MEPSMFGAGLGWSTGVSSLVEDTGVYNKEASCCKEYAVNENANSKYRPYMEDTFCCDDNFAGDVTCGLFGVFDGHGGSTVSEYLKERFPDEIKSRIETESPSDLVAVIEETFEKIDDELKMMDSEACGSTACIGIIRMESGHKVLYIANVGDTRAVLSRNGVEERLSVDHKASEKSEHDRVIKEGGIIMNDRVGGTLVLTRAMGDFALKDSGVTCKPTIKKHFIRPFDRFVVIASDGVYDTMSDEDVVKMCDLEESTDKISKDIIVKALENGSQDNLCCCVIKL
ncbi:unnamed protein product [Moneuplotes crassus]|uniref:PPM-type phosphatase domain-containing protein n=2 Tax=Euplotes crassus TaxID=5936 RepID=A0AAD1XQS0_EUPCR|nr:unnamed protein product [Moneuplotes crassus]